MGLVGVLCLALAVVFSLCMWVLCFCVVGGWACCVGVMQSSGGWKLCSLSGCFGQKLDVPIWPASLTALWQYVHLYVIGRN